MQNQNEYLEELEDDNESLLDSHLSEESQLISNQDRNPFLSPNLNDGSEEQPEVQHIQESSVQSAPLALNQNDSQIKEEDLKAIDSHGMDANRLYENIKRGIETAMVQGPKGELLEDWKARANLINAFMKATGRFKPDNTINILNLFGKVNTENNKDIY